jgi:PAS domain S-box-containing protein
MEEGSVLILAPIGRDGAAASEIVARTGVMAKVCRDFGALVDRIDGLCLAVIATEEGLFGQDLDELVDRAQRQPAWSDLPFILLTSQIPVYRVATWRSALVASLGNVTLLERPVQAITLTSAVRAALRARQRQYDLRTLLGELEQGNERFRLIVENARDYAIIFSDADDMITDWLPGAASVFGWSAAEMIGKPVSSIFTPEDRAQGIPDEELDRARAVGEAPNIRWHVAKGGERVFLDGQTVALRHEDGTVRGFLKIGKDITERQRNEERQAVLLAELQHRVRNVLAMVASLVNRGDSGGSTEEFRERLSGRIAAMARTQTLLTRGAGLGVDLGGIVRDELLAQAADEARIHITGPPVLLAPKAAEVLTLAVHELATNAAKYGAIGKPGGHIDVCWTNRAKDGRDWLELEWKESGVTIATAGDQRKGFGTELITRRVPYEMKGEGTLSLEPDGLRCRIAFPLRDGDSILQTDVPAAFHDIEGKRI